MTAEAGRSRFSSRAVEIAANLATLVAALLLSVVLVRNYLVPTSPSRPAQTRPATVGPSDLVGAGTDLGKRLPDIGWNRNGRTVVLALSTYCHFCTESAPFFRRMRESVGKDVKVVGVFPQPVAAAESYLKREGVRLDEIRQVSLDKVGVAGTPTMLLVNSKGIVTQTWVGKLAPDKHEEALKTILGVRSAAFRSGAAAVLDARR